MESAPFHEESDVHQLCTSFGPTLPFVMTTFPIMDHSSLLSTADPTCGPGDGGGDVMNSILKNGCCKKHEEHLQRGISGRVIMINNLNNLNNMEMPSSSSLIHVANKSVQTESCRNSKENKRNGKRKETPTSGGDSTSSSSSSLWTEFRRMNTHQRERRCFLPPFKLQNVK